MATTITTGLLGTGALGGAAAAAVVAGAVGLGFAGATALAGRRGRRGGGRRRGNRRRGRRSAEEEADALNNVMTLIRQEDDTGCGMRLMCELAGLREEELGEVELAILDLVGPRVRPGEGLLPPGGAGDYMIAKTLGQKGENCGQMFPMCPLDGTQLMDTVKAFLP